MLRPGLPSLIWLVWKSPVRADICARGSFLSSPQAVQDMTVRKDPQHDVVGGGVMDEWTLRVDEEHIGHPDFLHQAPVEGHALVGWAREGQPLVLPVVPQVESHGEVLGERGRGDRNRNSLWIKSHYEDSTCLQPLVYWIPLGLHCCGLCLLDYMDCLWLNIHGQEKCWTYVN